MKIRGRIFLFIGVALSFVFFGCTKKDEAKKSTFVIFQSKVEITTQLEAAAKAYQAETGVEVEVWSTTGDDYFHQLRTRIATNQGPTLFSIGPGAEATELRKYLDDLGDLSFVGNITGSLLEKQDGKIVGIPYTMEGFGIVYNKSLLNPAQVRDYASFVAALQQAKAGGINGFGLSQESYFLIGHILNTPFALIPDMKAYMEKLDRGEVKMAETPEFQEFAKFYTAIRDYSYNPLEVNYDKECGDFATGKTAAIHQGNWCYNMFTDYDLNFEMGLMPFPLLGNDRLAVSVPTVWAINAQVPADQRKLAKDFLTWLYTSPTGIRYITEEFGFIPVVQGVTSAALDPLSAEVSRYALEGKIIPWATSFYPAGIVDTYLVPVAQRFFTSKMSEGEFLAALDQAWAKANGR
ncbi:MAG: ABC transporter substrate-binding protein [Treponema sp.]|jgi:raffinose/stachyose/melibiose transport system substrate-binding protein|nr:ABC transporter substrate-binding protein [Treponema sp.]